MIDVRPTRGATAAGARPGRPGRIVLVLLIDEICGWTAGTERQVLLLCRHLPRWGVAPVLALMRAPSPRLQLPEGSVVLGVSLKRYLYPLAQRRIASWLRDLRPDALIAFFPMGRWVGLKAAREAAVPVRIFAQRNFGATEPPWFLRARWRVSRHATEILCNSRRAAEILAGEAPAWAPPVAYLPNLVEIDGVPRAAPAAGSPVTIGIAANLRPVKRVDIFLEAARRLGPEEARFEVVGDGPERVRLERLARELGIAGRVAFRGQREDSRSLMATWQIGTLTSDTEGLSNTILEYMAAGLPVVATDTGGNPELVEHGATGFLVPAGDPEALAAAWRRLVAEPELRGRFGDAAREKAAEFEASRVARRYREHIAALLGQVSPR
ncbi:MAG: glycosyltransferase [Acidobacteria bacterium]|nr:MAG: glycosyltransferase [Acidobacteriota bacterium]